LTARLLATNLLPATVEDLLKLDAGEIAWAVEEHGRCSVVDALGGRKLALVAHGDKAQEVHRCKQH